MTHLRFALLNTKGGCGKTTSALFLAREFLTAGFRVHLIDTDKQGSAHLWVATSGMDDELDFTQALGSREITTALREPAAEGCIEIIDCPPGDETTLQAVAEHCDYFLIPCKATFMDVDRAQDTAKTLSSIGKSVLVMLTMVNRQTKAFTEAQEVLEDLYRPDMYVRQLEHYASAFMERVPADTKDYASIARTLRQEWMNNS